MAIAFVFVGIVGFARFPTGRIEERARGASLVSGDRGRVYFGQF